MVCGRVDCSSEYPSSDSGPRERSAIAASSAGVRSSNVSGSGGANGGTRWMPATCVGSCCARLVVTLVPQSWPPAPYRSYPSDAISAAHAAAVRSTVQPGRSGRSLNP